LAGIEAQKRLQEEADLQEKRTQILLQESVLDEQEAIQRQIEEDKVSEDYQRSEESTIQQDESKSDTQDEGGQNPPPFPIEAMVVAVFKDIFDVILTFTGVGVLLVELYTAIYDTCSFAWALKRMESIKASKKSKSEFKSKLIRRFVTMICVSLVPVLDMLPEASITVWRNYKAEVALAKSVA
jgi:hypothetical protein